jgi:hypothetical protein
MGVAAAVLLLVAAAVDSPLAAHKGWNAAAEAVARGSLALGIDFEEKESNAPRPAADDVQAYSRAGFGQWLDSQIQTPDDSIAEPPAALAEFLRDRRGAVWAVVEAIEKDTPEWGLEKGPNGVPVGKLLPIFRLERVLVSLALCEERQGEAIDASRALEASWSLGTTFAHPVLLDQLLAISIDRWQSGALRKMREPPLQWLGRLGANDNWARMVEAVAHDSDSQSPRDAIDDLSKSFVEAARSAADTLRKVSPCDVSSTLVQEIWMSAAEAATKGESAERGRSVQEIVAESLGPNGSDALRRAARLSVDRELTLRILELRLEKAGSREGAWPEKLVNSFSAVCPGATYAYRADEKGMELRFEGTVPDPSHGNVLPLEFKSHAPSPTPTPMASPVRTPTPPPSNGSVGRP